MPFNHSFFAAPDLETTIDRQPLLISPDTTLQEAIALMSQIRGSNCNLAKDNQDNTAIKPSSCALVTEGEEIKGILTERDIVKLTASAIAFKNVTVAEVMTSPVVTLKENNFQDIFAALFLFRRYRIRHLPLVDDDDRLIGVISPETIRHAMRPANLLKLRRVADVMSKNIITADVTTSVLKLAQLMTENRVSCIIITQEDIEENIIIPVGIITERDIMQFQFLELNLSQIMAEEVMSSPLLLLSPEDSLLTAHQEMAKKRVRRLVVSWNWGRGLGIITQTSLLKIFDPMEMYSVIESLQRTVLQLENENRQLRKKTKDNS